MDQKHYWDDVSSKKQFTTPFQAEAFCKFVNKDAAILDVGCGYGRTLNELHQQGYCNLTGIDFSEGMIARGKKEYPALDLRVKRNETIDLADSSIDAVILFAVLTCIHKDAEQEMLISEIKRVLKPGGILYINDFLLNSDDRNIKRYEQFQEKYGTYGVFELPEGAVCRHHDEAHIHSLLSSFEQLCFEHLTFVTMNGHRSNGFYYIGKLK